MAKVRLIPPAIFVLCLVLILEPVRSQDVGRIDTILDTMTLEQRVAQLFMVNLYGAGLSQVGRELLQTWQPGAVVLLASNIVDPEQVTRLTNAYQQTIVDARGLPLFIATDQEGGLIERLKDGFTTWPVPMLLTAADDPVLAYQVGQGMARELRAVGINMNLAPVADLQTNRENPIIGRRSPGSHPDMVGRTVAAVVDGMQSGGVMATLKHFPGHGDTSEDSHTALPVVTHDLKRLTTVELPPFAAAMDAGAVMMAHIWFTEFDPEAPIPASLSSQVVTGLLRGALGYEGIVMTDALDMDAIDTTYSLERAVVMAFQAGNDMVIMGPGIGEVASIRAMRAVVDAVKNGELSEDRIDESVRRILEAKQRFDILDWRPLDPSSTSDRMDRDSNASLIEDVFRAGVTLVYDTYQVVPLSRADRVGIIFPGNRASIQRECGAYSDTVRWYAISDSPTADEVSGAVYSASQVDAVIVFTRDAYFNTAQQTLVQSLPPDKTIVVALISPYDLLRFPEVAGYLVTYSPLDAGISTVCAILFGELPPQGTLSVDLLPR